MPDQILVYEGSRVGAVAYSELRANAGLDVFSEDGPVPADARVIGTTWRYVNKDGSPDRRFKSNRQISIVQYGSLQLESSSRLREHFQCPRAEASQTLSHALARMAVP